MLAFDANPAQIFCLRANPFPRSRQPCFAPDAQTRPLPLRPSLCRVAPIGEEDTSLFADREHTSAAGEATEIADVGRVSYQKRVDFGGREGELKTLQPGRIVH